MSDASSGSASGGASRPDPVEDLREQVGRDRRELAETVGALHDKADVKERVRETAGSLSNVVRRATTGALGRLRKQLSARNPRSGH